MKRPAIRGALIERGQNARVVLIAGAARQERIRLFPSVAAKVPMQEYTIAHRCRPPRH